MYFIDLFSGPGGLTSGLKTAGLKPVIAIDSDKDACATYKINNPEVNVINRDINLIDPIKLKEELGDIKIDLICGGSPCQSFSTIGLRKKNDPRSNLFFQFVRFAEVFNPDFLVFENVKGILSYQNGKVIKHIRTLLKKQGYTLNYSLINCLDIGMTQRRERVIFVAHKKSVFKFPEIKKFNNVVPLKEIIGDIEDVQLDIPNHEYVEPRKLDLDRITYIPEGKYFRNNRKGGVKNDIFPSSNLFLKEGEGKTQKYYKLSKYTTTPTVLTNWYSVRAVGHYNNRPLTAREVARIQSFPDSFVFTGNLKSIYKQLGNAVPPKLAEYVGKLVMESSF